MRFSGVRLPIITPFKDGEIDHAGYARLLDHYARAGISGVIPLGTTGESPILVSAHVETATFLAVYERMVALLFKEPSPAPIKHCL